ncbi:hypothetical protein KL86DYS2_13191 [uncultured Dysgonomonas sp.]|uniref:Uncharacterized protein n=1 Tax=uncultured Dysgonomonas sp. TaxID=206096 RepID=A0A212K7A7_9BACT|nr:hypothetical protein KL86DYS2_13191 [uncultured Dysgonomonas sp.]
MNYCAIHLIVTIVSDKITAKIREFPTLGKYILRFNQIVLKKPCFFRK